jgi:class 3 adenylate cyclase
MKISFFKKSGLKAENEQLKAELEKLKQFSTAKNTIVDLRDGIVIVDSKNNVEYINSPFARILGIIREEFQGKPLARFDGLLGREKILQFLCQEIKEAGIEIQRSVTLNNPKTKTPLFYFVKVRRVGEGFQILFEDHTIEQSIEDLFKRYVAPSVVEQLKQEKKDPFAASLREMTVLFGDLRGFSSAIESMPPQQVRLMINDFFSVMVEVVNRYHGTLDKFIGDGIMVLFGAPITSADHAERAVKAAGDMQKAHDDLLKVWGGLGMPRILLGIGINTGKMIVGNIGSTYRMEYTALGHAVNLASRICDAALGNEILISQETKNKISQDFHIQSSRLLHVPGIQEEVHVHSLLWK